MANRKAQIKTITVNGIRRTRNKSLRTMLHTQMRRLDEAVASGDADRMQDELSKSLVRLDKSVTKGIIHKNKAARTKSRLCARIAAAKG